MMNYKKIYAQLIRRAKERNWTKKTAPCYVERHHINPKSMGGSNDKKNLVCLTAREHFLVHWMLYKIYKNQSMACAWIFMSADPTNEKKRYSSHSFKYARESFIKNISGDQHPSYGIDFGLKYREALIRGHNKRMDIEKYICPHCKESLFYFEKDKYHFNNCRMNKTNSDIIYKKYGVMKNSKTGIAFQEFEKSNFFLNSLIDKSKCSVGTLYNLVTKYNKINNSDKRIIREKKITKKNSCLKLISKGVKDVQQIANIVGCSESTVTSALRELRKYNQKFTLSNWSVSNS